MYYSKNSAVKISVPQNYSGNTFRVEDESDRTYSEESNRQPDIYGSPKENDTEEKSDTEVLSDNNCSEETRPDHQLFGSISAEDLLLLGLIFVIHEEHPNDPSLLILLLLLLAK